MIYTEPIIENAYEGTYPELITDPIPVSDKDLICSDLFFPGVGDVHRCKPMVQGERE